jgi:hypothetical protein
LREERLDLEQLFFTLTSGDHVGSALGGGA